MSVTNVKDHTETMARESSDVSNHALPLLGSLIGYALVYTAYRAKQSPG